MAGVAIVLGALLVWLLVRSGGDESAADTTTMPTSSLSSPGDPAATTTAPLTTTTAPTTTAAPTTTTTLPTDVVFWEPPRPAPGQTVASGYGAGRLANGSGCTTPAGPATGYWTLPDGTWFGFMTDMWHNTLGGGWLEFDMGCFYEGTAAIAEAAYDGTVPYQGFYVRNEIRHLFAPDVVNTATVLWVDAYGDHRSVPFSSWPEGAIRSALNCPGSRCAVWVTVVAGRVYEIVEQPNVIATAAD